MPKDTILGGISSHNFWYSGVLLWAVATLGVWVWTTCYEFTTYAADNAQLKTHWPADSSLELADDRPSLLVFMHPQCPCTRASLRELERILAGTKRAGGIPPKLIAVVSLPHNAPAPWRDTDTVRRVVALPGAELVWDVGGDESSRFGVVTSGAVRLFRPDGALLYAGGVTSSRGHEGDNAGADRLLALLCDPSSAQPQTFPEFGCRLCINDPTTSCPAPQGAELAAVPGVSQ